MKNKNERFSYWRIAVAHDTFIKMAVKNFRSYLKNCKLLKNACDKIMVNDNGMTQYDIVDDELEENFICIIIFSALFMESYIYDYAARNLGDKYVTEHLDQLDIISKWIIIPKLITNKEINKTHHSFEIFKKTIQLRNKIVHWKSNKGTIERLQNISNRKLYESINPQKIFDSILFIFTQLEKMDNNDHHLMHVSAIKK
jgi:hypothetical protein